MGRHSAGDDASFRRSVITTILRWVAMGLLPVIAAVGIWRWIALQGEDPAAKRQVRGAASPSPTPTLAEVPEEVVSEEPIPDETSPPAAVTGKVQVLNGSGTPGLALDAKEKLEQAGNEVVATSNASRRYETTTVFYQPGHLELANQVATLLGASKVEPAPSNLDEQIPVTAVVGADYKS